MEDVLHRLFDDIMGRIHGPLTVRLILQPIMAIIFAVRDGRKDALAGNDPYFWAIFTKPNHRRELLRSGWKGVGKVFLIAVLIDAVYQVIAFRWIYPGETLIVAVILAFVPYLLLRGPVNRFWPVVR